MNHAPLQEIRRTAALLSAMAIMLVFPSLGAGEVAGPQPLLASGPTLAALPGPAARDLDCLRGADGRYTVFYTTDGGTADPGRIAWVSGISGRGAANAEAGLLPLGWSEGARAYGPAGLLLPGETHPTAAWIERQDGGCRVFCAGPAGRWAAPEAVFTLPVDLVRFLDGAGPWLVWVESHTYTDEIVACHRGPGGWERPVALSLADDSEDLSPRVALHPSGAPWVIWAGSRDGGRDEIFLSRLQKGEWVREQPVSMKDDTPDVLPDLAISPGGLACAVWLGFARETRDYQVTVSFSPDGETWSGEARLGQGSFARPPRLALLENGRFLLVWSDAAGNLFHAEHDGKRWSAPRKVITLGGEAASPGTASLLLLHRSNRADGSLVALPRRLP